MPTGCSAGRWTHRKGITDEPFTTFEMALVHRPLACKRAFARRCRLGDTDGTSPMVTRQWEISESSLMKTVSPTDLRLAALHHEDKVNICRTRHLDGFLIATIHHRIEPTTILGTTASQLFSDLGAFCSIGDSGLKAAITPKMWKEARKCPCTFHARAPATCL